MLQDIRPRIVVVEEAAEVSTPDEWSLNNKHVHERNCHKLNTIIDHSLVQTEGKGRQTDIQERHQQQNRLKCQKIIKTGCTMLLLLREELRVYFNHIVRHFSHLDRKIAVIS